MTIYNPDGTTFMQGLQPSDDSYRTAELMGDDCLMLKFALAEHVEFPLRSHCAFEGRTYHLFTSPEITKQHSRNFEYSMPMYTAAYLLKTTLMRNTVDLRLKFPLTATACEHLEMIVGCLNTAENSSEWSVDYANTLGIAQDDDGAYIAADGTKYNDEGEAKLVSYDFVYLDEALKAVAEAFDTEFEIMGKTIALHDVEHNKDTPLFMSYGKGNGFKGGIARKNDCGMPPIDRLYIQGGEHNIPEHYGMKASTSAGETTYTEESPNYIKSPTLLLPKGAAVFYDGGSSYWFSLNPTVQYDSNGIPYIKAKDYRTVDTNLPIYEVLYDNKGNGMGSTLLYVGIPCFLVSADGRSLCRVRHTYYDPYYTPRATNVEASFDASEIYPMRVGGVSAVQSVSGGTSDTGEALTFYDIYDAGDDCPNYRDCYISGETMTIVFQDGMLAGREFELNTYSSGTYKDQPVCESTTLTDSTTGESVECMKLELCQSEQDGLSMPDGAYVPAVGDHYIAFHCSLPEEYVSGIAYGAEFRVLREAARYLYHHGKATYTFTGSVDGIWAKQVWSDIVERYNTAAYGYLQIPHSAYFALGQHIKVKDVQLFGSSGLVMRVTAMKQPVNNPRSIEMTLTNALTLKFNWVSHLSQTVREVMVRPPTFRPRLHRYTGDQIGLRRKLISIAAESIRIGGRTFSLNLVDTDAFNPALTRVSTLEAHQTQLLNAHNILVEVVNANTQRFTALQTAVTNFNAAQGGNGNQIDFSTCINVGTDKQPVCRPMNDVSKLTLK